MDERGARAAGQGPERRGGDRVISGETARRKYLALSGGGAGEKRPVRDALAIEPM
jgi:hypothetical protein